MVYYEWYSFQLEAEFNLIRRNLSIRWSLCDMHCLPHLDCILELCVAHSDQVVCKWDLVISISHASSFYQDFDSHMHSTSHSEQTKSIAKVYARKMRSRLKILKKKKKRMKNNESEKYIHTIILISTTFSGRLYTFAMFPQFPL